MLAQIKNQPATEPKQTLHHYDVTLCQNTLKIPSAKNAFVNPDFKDYLS